MVMDFLHHHSLVVDMALASRSEENQRQLIDGINRIFLGVGVVKLG